MYAPGALAIPATPPQVQVNDQKQTEHMPKLLLLHSDYFYVPEYSLSIFYVDLPS